MCCFLFYRHIYTYIYRHRPPYRPIYIGLYVYLYIRNCLAGGVKQKTSRAPYSRQHPLPDLYAAAYKPTGESLHPHAAGPPSAKSSQNMPSSFRAKQTYVSPLALTLHNSIIVQADYLVAEQKRARGSKALATWETHSSTFRAAHDIAKSSSPWTGRPGARLRGVPQSARCMDLVNVCYAMEHKKAPLASSATITTNLRCDISQAVQRKPWSYGSRTFLSSSFIYDFS
jgi:hypothetical protein